MRRVANARHHRDVDWNPEARQPVEVPTRMGDLVLGAEDDRYTRAKCACAVEVTHVALEAGIFFRHGPQYGGPAGVTEREAFEMLRYRVGKQCRAEKDRPQPEGERGQEPSADQGSDAGLDCGLQNRPARALYDAYGFREREIRRAPNDRMAKALGGPGFVGYVKDVT